MVFAQIGMGQHEIAQRLGVAQTGAMADHQPGMGPQHRDVIGCRLGVGRADTDVDQRDPRPVRPLEVIGGHLRRLDRIRNGCVAIRDLHVSGADKGGIAAVRVVQLRAGKGFELGHVELVVGEHDMALEMFGGRGGVMRQTRQRIIHALRGKGCQRAHPVGFDEGTVHDIIVCRAQVRHVKDIAQDEIARPFLRQVDGSFRGDSEMDRDRRVRGADDNRLAVVLDQQADLLDQVVPKQVRPCDRCRKCARRGHMAKRKSAVHMRIA